jgi:conjugative transfer region protein TrbK
MDLKIAARMIAVLALVAAMTATVMVLRNDGPEEVPSHRLRDPGGEPPHSELRRCRDLGVAATDDVDCRKAWTENRRRFLGTREPAAVPTAERFRDRAQPKTSEPPISVPVSP